jgi:hypothetical protein
MTKSVFVSTRPRAPLGHNKFYTLSLSHIKMMRLRILFLGNRYASAHFIADDQFKGTFSRKKFGINYFSEPIRFKLSYAVEAA